MTCFKSADSTAAQTQDNADYGAAWEEEMQLVALRDEHQMRRMVIGLHGDMQLRPRLVRFGYSDAET